jgi:glycolate oxidase FAD binding subunit
VLVRVAAAPSALADVLDAADRAEATVVGRAALGQSFMELAPEEVAGLRERLPAGAAAVVLDAPAGSDLDRWGPVPGPALDLMHRVKRRFDPAGTCNPGLFVGGI